MSRTESALQQKWGTPLGPGPKWDQACVGLPALKYKKTLGFVSVLVVMRPLFLVLNVHGSKALFGGLAGGCLLHLKAPYSSVIIAICFFL